MGNAWREAMARVAARRRSRTARASGGKVGRQAEEAAHPEKISAREPGKRCKRHSHWGHVATSDPGVRPEQRSPCARVPTFFSASRHAYTL